LDQEPLLLLVPPLHLLPLLFKDLGVILQNVGVSGGRHNNIETRVKNFLLSLYIVDSRYHYGIFWENPIELQINSIELQRLSPKGGILSYASPPIWKIHLHGKIISQNLQAYLP